MKKPVNRKKVQDSQMNIDQIWEELDGLLLDQHTNMTHLNGRLFDKTVKRLEKRWTQGNTELAILLTVMWFHNVSKYLRDKLGPAFIGAQMVDVEEGDS